MVYIRGLVEFYTAENTMKKTQNKTFSNMISFSY
jgi:hypothetical protein